MCWNLLAAPCLGLSSTARLRGWEEAGEPKPDHGHRHVLRSVSQWSPKDGNVDSTEQEHLSPNTESLSSCQPHSPHTRLFPHQTTTQPQNQAVGMSQECPFFYKESAAG